MNKKSPLKSKTILFSLVTIAVALFNMLGPSEKPLGEMSFRELQQRQGHQTENITNMSILAGGGGAVYGRVVAKDKIGGKNNE